MKNKIINFLLTTLAYIGIALANVFEGVFAVVLTMLILSICGVIEWPIFALICGVFALIFAVMMLLRYILKGIITKR